MSFLLGGLLLFSSAAYPALINVVDDHLTMTSATSSPYGNDDLDYYTGAALNKSVDQRVITSVDNADMNIFGSYYAHSQFTATDYPQGGEYYMYMTYFTDHPYQYQGDAPGNNLIEVCLQLTFDVMGHDGSLRFDGTHYGQGQSVNVAFNLYDMTTNVVQTGISQLFSLTDSHRYMMTYQCFIDTSSDLDIAHDILIRGAVVPEPSTFLLLFSGLIGLSVLRKQTRASTHTA